MTCRGLLTPTLWWVHLQLLYSGHHCEKWMKQLLRKMLHIQVDHRWCLGFNSSCGNNKQNLPFTTFPCQTSEWMLLFITNWSLVLNALHTITPQWLFSAHGCYGDCEIAPPSTSFFLSCSLLSVCAIFHPAFLCESVTVNVPPSSSFLSLFLLKWIIIQL